MNSKRTYFKVLTLVLLLAAAVPPLVIWWPRITPFHKVSDLYHRFEDNEHVDASFVKDFKVNDSVTVDVTVLKAMDDSGWALIRQNIRILPLTEELLEIIGDEQYSEFCLLPKKDYSLRMDSVLLNNDVVAIRHFDSMVSVFHIETEVQLHDVQLHQIDECIDVQLQHHLILTPPVWLYTGTRALPPYDQGNYRASIEWKPYQEGQ